MPERAERVDASDDDALGEHDAVGLVEELAAGRVSPVEVATAARDRIARVDGRLGAVAAVAVRAPATRVAPGTAWFDGVPTMLKDNCDLAGLPTQQGSAAFEGRPVRADGDVARGLRLLGLDLLGKTRLSEFGFSASAEPPGEPPVANPWDTRRTAGASSAGAAALVAAGALPLAHGNDGGGSIRIPAACCGLVGLKPSRGRTPSDAGNRRMPVRIVSDGVLTRSVRDQAAYLRESEKVYRDVRLPPVGDVRGPSRKRQRIAMITDTVDGRRLHPDVTRTLTETATLLESLGHRVEPIENPVPAGFPEDFLAYWQFLAAAVLASGKAMHGRSFDASRTDNLTRGLARGAARRPWRVPGAIRTLAGSSSVSARLSATYDALLCPTVAHPTPLLGHLDPAQPYDVVVDRLLDWVTFTPWQNATGEPAVSLPMGATAEGLPVGVMLGAARGREVTLLHLAFELEEARPFARISEP